MNRVQISFVKTRVIKPHHLYTTIIAIFALQMTFVPKTFATVNDYTFSCWLNGWRKNVNDQSPDLFGVETSQYGFVLDMDDLNNARFGKMSNSVCYEHALKHKADKFNNIPPAEFLIELEVDGIKYISGTCKAGLDKSLKRLSNARMWESGRYVQHFDFLGVDFKNSKGQILPCNATLDLMAWPDSLTFNLHVIPANDLKNTSMRLGLKTSAGNWNQSKEIEGTWKKDHSESISLTCMFSAITSKKSSTKILVNANDSQNVPVFFDKSKNCHVALVKHLKRSWRTGYTDIRNYDDFEITVKCSGNNESIPFLLDMRPPANITGLCPILCDEKGRPTGVPVQLSKNWHYKAMGSYLMAYAMLPATDATYRLRIVYGFYGKLPSASHAQLSLVGYSDSNGRWDQLAIGCWGETICFDMDMSCVDVAITDIRMLMARNGADGKKWGWSDAGWGGDWLNICDNNQKKYFINGMKTAYLSHGPCLTDVRHTGYYGKNKEVDFDIQIQTLRTDDYARTFQKFSYTFNRNVSAERMWLFKLGRTHRYSTPKLAYGNINGLIKNHNLTDQLKENQVFLNSTTLNGPGPWWVALPGAVHTSDKDWGSGYRALIIRDYKVTSGGKHYSNPTIRAPVFKSSPNNLDIELLPPAGITDFKKNDSIQLDLELITLHRCAGDYYGPNKAYRKHLAEEANSWKTAYREAKGNDLKISAVGGKVLNNYPIIIQVLKPEIIVTIEGGVGAVPIRFEGLKSAVGCNLYQLIDGKRVKLNQSVHGNDFWQVDYDTSTGLYKITYNIPLDDLKKSQWVLSQNSN